jgi:hypothetical protein
MKFLPIIINDERWWTDARRTVVAETKRRVLRKLSQRRLWAAAAYAEMA